MDTYPQNLVDQYIKASSKLKKFDRVVFKRFAPNVGEVIEDFTRLAIKFEEAGIDNYAGMCYLGIAKCQMSAGNRMSEIQGYLKAARAFLRSHSNEEALHTKSVKSECKEGALRCYTLAVDRCPDDDVFKASIIREMKALQPNFNDTSSFSSPAHHIYELEMAANNALQNLDFLTALSHLDDIVDNVVERKKQTMYEELLCRVEILRVFLLMALNLPPSRQSPSHIKLIEFYYQLGNFEEVEDVDHSVWNISSDPGAFVSLEMKYAIAEAIFAWFEHRLEDLKLALEVLRTEFTSLNSAQLFVIDNIMNSLDKQT